MTNCHGLKMVAADGKMRLTDVADTEQLLRFIQSIPKEKDSSAVELNKKEKRYLTSSGGGYLFCFYIARSPQEEQQNSSE